MVRGTLEVLLIGAKGLANTDFLGKMDPYAVLTYRTQEKKSGVATGQGSEPDWNETFLFTVTDSLTELNIKLMDKDTFTSDDFVGEVNISLEAVLELGNVPPSVYNVVKNQEYCGEIKVGLAFFPEEISSRDLAEEEYGGWKQSYN